MALIGTLAFIFIGLTITNRVLEGAFVSGAEFATINSLTVFREAKIFGLFSIPVPNLSFITDGLPHLVKWDYSFFGGNAAIVQYFMYAFTAVLSYLVLPK